MPILLKELCATAGLKRVVWIDDLFATNVDVVARDIAIKIPALLNAGQSLEHRALASTKWNPAAGPETFAQQVQEVIGANKGMALAILASLLEQQKRHDPDLPGMPADLNGAQVALIKAAFTDVDLFGYATWQAGKEKILAAADDSVLFLVDRDFGYEIPGGQNKGAEILRELLTRPNLHGAFILLSHSFVQENELKERDEFSVNNACHAGFAFISKERLTRNAGNLAEQNQLMGSAVRDALVRSWCHRAAETASNVVAKAAKAAHHAMLNQTFDDLGGGIFHLSQRDGVPETETLARLFMLAGRIALQDEMLNQSTLHQQLEKLRKVIKETKYAPEKGKNLGEKLNEWRNREVWDPPAIVNGACAQPSCGDIYVYSTDGKERTFLLLGQPCNLAVRANGKRNDNEALFAEVELEKPKNLDACKEIIWNGVTRYARFDWVFPVNLWVLDAVASSTSGQVKFEFSKPLPVGVLLGMTNRLVAMAKILTDAPGPEIPFECRTFSVSDALRCAPSFDKANGVFQAPLKRIGRIRSPYADAVFGALANYHTRMAFDFDFSKIPA